MTKNEFSRPVVLANIPRSGQRESLAATPEECEALARRLGLLSLGKLEAKVALTPQAGGNVAVRGRMQASVTQACVVTLEPVTQEIDEEIDWRVPPPAAEPSEPDEEDILEGPDEVEAENGVLDLGEALAQQLALSLDPYPRAPGAGLGPEGAGDKPVTPFSALSRLKRGD